VLVELISIEREHNGKKRNHYRQPNKRTCLPSHFVGRPPLKLSDDASPSWTRRANAPHALAKLLVRRVKDFFLKWHQRMRPNENKISDGYRERALIEVEVF
jgi:hypothetical protein